MPCHSEGCISHTITHSRLFDVDFRHLEQTNGHTEKRGIFEADAKAGQFRPYPNRPLTTFSASFGQSTDRADMHEHGHSRTATQPRDIPGMVLDAA